MTGILTTKTKIYKYAKVFVYHFSRYSYMRFQQTASAEQTLEGKYAFETMAASHGIIIKKYHDDNGIFIENAWVQYCQERANPQLTTYAEVDYHHTNGLSEKRIRDNQENVRSMMLHSQQKQPEDITANLWPYALIHANNTYNATRLLAHPHGISLLHIFKGTQVQDNPKHWNPFC